MSPNARAEAQQIAIAAWPKPLFVLGDAQLLSAPLTGFLCSQEFPAKAVLPIYHWARTARDNGEGVICGFHAPLERDVLNFLLAGTQAIVWTPARSLPQRIPRHLQAALTAGRLLIASALPPDATRPTAKHAALRNRFIMAIAAKIVVGYAAPGGSLAQTLAAADPAVALQYITPPSATAHPAR